MLEEDKQWLETLLLDKGKQYAVIIDNDEVFVTDKKNEGKIVHNFTEFGYCFLQQVFVYLGLDADFC